MPRIRLPKRLLQLKAMTTMEELFKQRDATEQGSKEEDQAVDRIMGAVFPEPKDRLQAAYEKFVNTPKGTPEHEQSGDELTDAIFANAKSSSGRRAFCRNC
jgi:hypothetical protein